MPVTDMMPAHRERGQTLPFWVISVLLSFALVFFVINYTYTMRYQIKAQNAADSAAVAALAEDANAANSVQTLLYALSIQEATVRGVDAAVTKLLGDPTNCSGGVSALAAAGSCLTNFTTLASEYAANATKYAAVYNELDKANTKLVAIAAGGLKDPATTVDTFFAGNCAALNTDCSFKYTTNVDTQPTLTAPLVVTETACRTVPSLASTFLGLKRSTFYALGRTKVTLAPFPTQISPGATNVSGLGLASRYRDLLPGVSLNGDAKAYQLDLAGVSATTGMLEPTTAGASTDPVDFSKQCG